MHEGYGTNRGKIFMEARFRNLEIIDDQMAEILRTKSMAERFAMFDQFWRLASQMIRVQDRSRASGLAARPYSTRACPENVSWSRLKCSGASSRFLTGWESATLWRVRWRPRSTGSPDSRRAAQARAKVFPRAPGFGELGMDPGFPHGPIDQPIGRLQTPPWQGNSTPHRGPPGPHR